MKEDEVRCLYIEIRKRAQAVFLEVCEALKIEEIVEWMNNSIERGKKNGD